MLKNEEIYFQSIFNSPFHLPLITGSCYIVYFENNIYY